MALSGAAIGAGKDRRSRTFGGAWLGAFPGGVLASLGAFKGKLPLQLAGSAIGALGGTFGAYKGYQSAVKRNKEHNKLRSTRNKLRTGPLE